jgi:hypothetical protein
MGHYFDTLGLFGMCSCLNNLDNIALIIIFLSFCFDVLYIFCTVCYNYLYIKYTTLIFVQRYRFIDNLEGIAI